MKNEYKVFVASSLRLEKHRSAALAAIKKANELVKEKDLIFSEFFYENRPISKINQKLEKKDAQAPADKALRESAIFFLIIDDKIRNLTQYEFELAHEYFNKGELPQYIFIFYNEQAKVESDAEGLNYNDFMIRENLQRYQPDSLNNVVTHSRVYPIPFSSIEDMEAKMAEELVAFSESEERPFSGALRGSKLTKDHFFTDTRRNERCPDLYLRREIDDTLDDALKTRKFVILAGPSLSGKTRAVMEALKATDDGWVYILRPDYVNDDAEHSHLVADIRQLLRYLALQNHPKLYIVLDNLDTWAQEGVVGDELKRLVDSIWRSNAVIVSTTSSKNLTLSGFNPREDTRTTWLEIQEMDEHDFAEVRDFFVSAGIELDERNLRYRRTGALFVDLNDVLGKYKKWLVKGTKVKKFAKKKLLMAIKALSIWRDDYMGDRTLMLSLAKYFCAKDVVNCEWEEDELEEACQCALKDLLAEKGMGVSSVSPQAPIIVQEYIYRYFIDNDGSLLEEGIDFTFLGEQKLVRQLLKFCKQMHDDAPDSMEALTVQVSRLCRRCNFKRQTVGWLYGLWSGVGEIPKADSTLAIILKTDREACKQNGDERMAHFYSKIIETYIYQGCDTIDEARYAYESCPGSMRTDHLLSALMRKANNQEERDIIKKMDDYDAMKDMPYVIAAEVAWASDYAQAKDALSRFDTSETPTAIARRLLDDDQKAYDVYQLRNAISTLACKVSYTEEYEDFCQTLRMYYLYLACDVKVLEMIRDKALVYHPNNLTIIDLLAVLQPYYLGRMAETVFGGKMDDSKAFTDSLMQSVEPTLRAPFTDETTVRLTISLVTSMLIRQLDSAPYDEVYDSIFNTLKRPHPLHKGKTLILRSSYTYTAMLSNPYCDLQQANNLLENDLIPHTLDAANNPLTINTYTLNMMMDKSKGERKRMYARMIDKLYDQLHKQRDAFTYSRLIAIADNLQDSLLLMEQMWLNGVKANVYVLNELMKRPDVTLAQTLGFLSLAEVDLPEGYSYEKMEWHQTNKGETATGPKADDKEHKALFDPNNVIRQLRPEMSAQQASWGNLFRKNCTTDMERKVLEACMTYLETKEPDLLKGGCIYNNFLTNDTYFPNVNAIMNFVRPKAKDGLFHPDSYTAKHVIDRILNMNGTVRLKAIDRLNELLAIVMEGQERKLDNIVVCHRIKIYKSHDETLKMVFFDDQGKMEEKTTSAVGYIETMQRYGYPIDRFAIGNLLNIREGLNDNAYNRLMEVLVRQQDTYTYTPIDLKNIRERCIGHYESYVDRIPALNTPLTAHEHNKAMAWKYRKGIAKIDDAMGSLDWSNPNSAICSFNDILDHLIDAQRKAGTVSLLAVMDYYNRYVKTPGHAPTSLTIAILAKATASWTDMQQLLNEYDLQKKTNPRLVLEPPLLSHLSSFTDTVRDLKQRTCTMHEKGCSYNLMAANNYVFRLASRLLALDTDPATAILNDLLHYVVEGGDVKQLLQQDERIYLMLDLFAEPQNVSPELLRTLIYYNASLPEEQRYGLQQMMECIKTKYYPCILFLLEMLAADATLKRPVLPMHEDMAEEDASRLMHATVSRYIPSLFNAIHNSSRPLLSGRLLGYMAGNLPKDSLGAYDSFLKRLYEMDCREIDEAVLSLAFFLKSYLSYNPTDRSEKASAARKALAQIIVYADLNKLRNGHLLVNKATSEYAQWCFRFMDFKDIRKKLAEKMHIYESLSWSDIIKHHTDRLDDAFPCSLKIYKKYADPTIQMDDDTYNCIRKQEHRYAMSIQRGEIYFSEVLKLPLLWINAKWKPSSELVMAMIKSLTRVAWTPGTNENYQKDALQRFDNIEKAFMTACRDKKKTTVIYYQYLSMLPSQDIHNREIPLPVMGRLLYELYLDHLEGFCGNGTYITNDDIAKLKNAECWCAKYQLPTLTIGDTKLILDNHKNTEFLWLQQLPERWKSITVRKGIIWQPSKNMVLSMLKFYVQFSKEKGENADKAFDYVKRIKYSLKANKDSSETIKIRYNMLGDFPKNDGQYINVPRTDIGMILPHKYIFALLNLYKKDSKCAVARSLSKKMIRKYQDDYTSNINKSIVTLHQIEELPSIWYNAKWHPSEELVLAIICFYVRTANKPGKDGDKAKKVVIKIKESLNYIKDDTVFLHYNIIGDFPSNNFAYYKLSAEKTLNALNI